MSDVFFYKYTAREDAAPALLNIGSMSPLGYPELRVAKIAEPLTYMMDTFKMNPPTGLLPPQE